MSSLPKLTYFDSAGRIYALRIALFKAFGKDGFVDKRIDFADWPALKPSTPLGSIPILELPDGTIMTQTDSLTRWAGKQASLYPSDPTEALKVDEVMHVAFEALNKTPVPPENNEEEKKRLREDYAAHGFLKEALALLNKRVTTAGLFVTGTTGASLNIGDLTIAMLTDMITTGDFDYVSPSVITDNYPALVAHLKQVKEHDLVKAYHANYEN